MFDQGQQLKAQYGNDKVFDFTLGNPYPEPPEEFKQALIEVAQDPRPGLHGYMTNAGYPFVTSGNCRVSLSGTWPQHYSQRTNYYLRRGRSAECDFENTFRPGR